MLDTAISLNEPYTPLEHMLVALLFTIVMVGLLCCILVLTITIRNWKYFKKQAANYALLPLVSFDMLINLVNTIILGINVIMKKWYWAQVQCHIMAYAALFCAMSSVLCILILTYERYSAIVTLNRPSFKKILYFTIATVCYSSLVMLFAFATDIPVSPGSSRSICMFLWAPPIKESSPLRYYAFSAICLSTIVVPILIVVFMNYKIYRSLKITFSTENPSSIRASGANDRKVQKKERKLYNKILIITLSFTILLAPYSIVIFYQLATSGQRISAAYDGFAVIFVALNYAMDAVLILILNEHYRYHAINGIKEFMGAFGLNIEGGKVVDEDIRSEVSPSRN